MYSAIGTTYGTGNGSTTFNIPQLEDNRFMEFYSTRGTKKNAGLPNITGTTYSIVSEQPYSSGALNGDDVLPDRYGVVPDANNDNLLRYLRFDASNSNTIYGGSNTTQPKSLTVRAIIKY